MEMPQDRLHDECVAYCSHLAKNKNPDISCSLNF